MLNARRICLVLATVVLPGGCAMVAMERPRTAAAPSEFHVPPAAVPPLGQCRIWYSELPPAWQPPAMPCPRAHSLAETHGGRVVKAISSKSFQDGRTLGVDYGPSTFPEVPPEQLPPPGYCRPWLERIPAERQPAPMTCERAREVVRQSGGRVVYMPGPETP